MNSTKPIRDPIYDYISITSLEREIIDTPDFQRLRFVLQNSTAFLTYPNANNCRFLHSLGTMHLAGRIFVHSLQNSSAVDLINLLEIFDKLVKPIEQVLNPVECTDRWKSDFGNTCRFLHNPLSGNPLEVSKISDSKYGLKEKGESTICVDIEHDPLYLINTFWQAVRVLGLVHDIGHLPMSHLFENAIKAFENKFDRNEAFSKEFAKKTKSYMEGIESSEIKEIKGYKDPPDIHEMRGIFIFAKLFPPNNPFYLLVNRLVHQVLVYNSAIFSEEDNLNVKVLRSLHRLVAGEIDADRLDYCVRDPVASGLELGAIDVERIVSNMVFCRDSQNNLHFVPNVKAISAVESFFHQRYLLYKYEIYHHNVARFDGLLEEILVWILRQAYTEQNPSAELIDLFDKTSIVKRKPVEGIRFLPDKHSAIYEDYWLRSLLSECLILLNDNDSLITLMLETFLYRKTTNLLSFWKRDSDIPDLLDSDNDKQKIKDLAPFTVLTRFRVRIYDEFVSGLQLKLGEDVLVISRKLKPKIHKPGDLSSSIYNGEVVRVEDISPYVSSLNVSIKDVPDVHLSVLCKNIKNDSTKRSEIREVFSESLREYLEIIDEEEEVE